MPQAALPRTSPVSLAAFSDNDRARFILGPAGYWQVRGSRKRLRRQTIALARHFDADTLLATVVLDYRPGWLVDNVGVEAVTHSTNVDISDRRDTRIEVGVPVSSFIHGIGRAQRRQELVAAPAYPLIVEGPEKNRVIVIRFYRQGRGRLSFTGNQLPDAATE